MVEENATDDGIEPALTLPPRQKTFLARYSRRSKLITTGLVLTGFVSMIFLVGQFLIAAESPTAGKHHQPKINGADNQRKNQAMMPQIGGLRNGNETSTSAEALNQQDDRSVPMAAAPDPDLTESTPQGDLPHISEDGRQPWQVYARPFNGADKRPRLAILVADLGLSRTITDAAVSRLPANVTLAFDAQSPTAAAWCARARQEGHETFLSVPMEPFDYPRSDPGPHTLLTTLSNSANLEKLNWALRQASGYVGIITMSGSRYTTDTEKLKLVMQNLHERGLMTVDTHIAPHGAVTDLAHDMKIPVAVANNRVDENLSPAAIDAALQQLEQAARLNGSAIGIFTPAPVVIDHLQKWLKTLPQQGIALAPVSALAQ